MTICVRYIIFYRVTYQAATSNTGQATASHRTQDQSSFSLTSSSRHRHKASTPSVIPIPSGGGKKVSTVESCCIWSAHVALDVSQLNVSILSDKDLFMAYIVIHSGCACVCSSLLSSTSVLPLLQVFHSIHTCYCDLTHAAYTSTKWWWISTVV